MPKTTAPKSTPSPSLGDDKPTEVSGASNRQMFVMAALNMSWQLAIVVLIPVVGGYKLDQLWDTTPLLTFVGLILATVGAALVLRRQLQLFGPPPTQPKGHKS